jgi:hypothetical protein
MPLAAHDVIAIAADVTVVTAEIVGTRTLKSMQQLNKYTLSKFI